jgi:SAM-dependent methyltransferase
VESNQQWQDAFDSYKALIGDPQRDTEYLRRTGLIPCILQLLGNIEQQRVLDAGCGTGWLFDVIKPLAGWECDLVAPSMRNDLDICSEQQDVQSMSYADEFFDVVVSSLVLMWVADLDAAFRESFRVVRPGGRLVVALTHPYFHTNGQVLGDGSFLIDRSLASQRAREDVMISGLVGPLTHYARPLLDYYKAALGARWRLVNFHDHFIDMEQYRIEAADRTSVILRTDKVPVFTFFVCEK